MNRRPSAPGAQEPNRAGLTASCFVVAATLLIVPLLFDAYGKDNFRLPKELAFRASAIGLLVAFVFWITGAHANVRSTFRRQLRDPVVLLTLLIVAWTGITTITSVNRQLSLDSLITVIASAIFFLGCRAAMRRRAILLLDVLVVAAVANATLTLLQRFGLWQLFKPRPGTLEEIDAIGLMGNTNDVGAFLAPVAIAALIVAVVARGKRRVVYSLVAFVTLAGLMASFARTSIIAYVVAIGAAAISSGGRLRRTALIVMAMILVLILWPGTEVGERYSRIAKQLRRGDLQSAVSGRLPAFIGAVEMFRDRPLLGTGPGTFKWLYMRYRLDQTGRYPPLWLEGMAGNFAEVHNDHLQIAAETGIPGYILLLTSLAVIARSRQRPENSLATSFSDRLRLPIAVLIFIVMLAHFPLQTASARTAFLLFAAFSVTPPDETS